MATLITGAGLVGSQIARIAVEKGERPVIYDVRPQLESIRQIVDPQKFDIVVSDVLNLEALEDLIRSKGITKIIHTAANPMLTVGAAQKPYDAIRLNIMGTVNILETARKLNIQRIVFTSSSVLYTYRRGGLESGKLSEDNYPRTTTVYASTKLTCENLGLNYVESYGLDFVAVRFGAVFGPWSGSGGGGPSVMFKHLIEKSLKGEEATLSPRAIDFVYSKDAARSTVLALESKNISSRIYNVGMGKMYTPHEIIDIVRKILPQARIKVEELSIGSPAVKAEQPMSLERSRKEIGYEPMYDMPRALEDYVGWYKQYS
ncbi:MAG TPA: NAD(P)-dependent oxidoreductase [Nitrososphaerales archaeon]|nr:NAD(P)-dependent oxidoreductase [Nitrososphaerales archaeon]